MLSHHTFTYCTQHGEHGLHLDLLEFRNLLLNGISFLTMLLDITLSLLLQLLNLLQHHFQLLDLCDLLAALLITLLCGFLALCV